MGLLDYEKKLSSLRTNIKRGGQKSPHQIAMLLAVIDLIETGDITNNQIFFNEALRSRFNERFKNLSSAGDVDNPYLPFFHLRSSGFWHHHVKPGMRSRYEKLETLKGLTALQEHIQYAFLDDELFELLGNSLVTKLLKTSLMQNLDDQARNDILRQNNNWTWLECEIVVNDYIEMLRKELAGISYNKADHRRALQLELKERSEKAIEYKYQNVSAAMIEIGLPYISGYKPAFNYQKQLKQALLARIARSPKIYDEFLYSAVEQGQSFNTQAVSGEDIFDTDPPETLSDVKVPERKYIGRRSNFSEREAQNRALGEAGESFVFQYEKFRLTQAGREDLANEVEWSSQEKGDGLGYDIRSFDETYESEIFLEVKTTTSGKYQPFFITENERAFAEQFADKYRLYRLYDFRSNPRIFSLMGRIENHVRLQPQLYRARI